MNSNELAILAGSLGKLQEVKKSLKILGIVGYNIQEDIETLKTDLKLFMNDNGIEVFHH